MPDRRALRAMARACSSVADMGFSTSTFAPATAQASTTS